LFTATFAESVLVHGGFLGILKIIFLKPWANKAYKEPWRLFTPFLLTGDQMEFLFDLYFCTYTESLLVIVLKPLLTCLPVYTYSIGLENSPTFNGPGDFAYYVAFLWLMITVSECCYYLC
jgi:Derlin-2/3